MAHNIFKIEFRAIYVMYVQKVEKHGRTVKELDEVICWLTGYDATGLKKQMDGAVDFEMFFAQAPKMNPNAALITGTICGYRVEEIADPLMQKIRWMDKLVDELYKGRPMEKILRK